MLSKGEEKALAGLLHAVGVDGKTLEALPEVSESSLGCVTFQNVIKMAQQWADRPKEGMHTDGSDGEAGVDDSEVVQDISAQRRKAHKAMEAFWTQMHRVFPARDLLRLVNPHEVYPALRQRGDAECERVAGEVAQARRNVIEVIPRSGGARRLATAWKEYLWLIGLQVSDVCRLGTTYQRPPMPLGPVSEGEEESEEEGEEDE